MAMESSETSKYESYTPWFGEINQPNDPRTMRKSKSETAIFSNRFDQPDYFYVQSGELAYPVANPGEDAS